MKLYQKLAHLLNARENCIKSNNTEWAARHKEEILKICKANLPSGAGIDCGTKFDFDKSKPDKLVFNVDFHHMNNGYYDNWTRHNIIVTPSLAFNLEMRITGPDRNDIKNYLADVFHDELRKEV